MNRERQITNYGLFTLEKIQRDTAIQVSGLLNSVVLCHRNTENEISNVLCEFIGKIIITKLTFSKFMVCHSL
jgi:hypothetical protein